MEKRPLCPLCSERAGPFCSDRQRAYLHCPACDLVFVPPEQHLSAEREKARYDLHRNDPSDPGYRRFLSRLLVPLQAKLSPGARGIDFGSGPGPALAHLFHEAGFPCAKYDLYYAPDTGVLADTYDFLACSETVEHVRRPREEFERFLRLVRPGGWIGIMTQLRDEAPGRFEDWHYRNDETHIGFFSRRTFEFLANRYGLEAEFHPGGVVLMRCPYGSGPLVPRAL